MDDPEFTPDDLTPQTASEPVAGEPAGNVPFEDVQAALDAAMDSLDQELPQPNLEAENEPPEPPQPTFEESEIPSIELEDNPLAEDPFVPPTEEVSRDVPLDAGLDEMDPSELPPQMQPQPASQQPQAQRGFSFPGLPSSSPPGETAQALGEDGFFDQKMEQEGAGRDAQSFMFRAETRHHGLMNEAMIEYGRHLDLISDRYERDRL